MKIVDYEAQYEGTEDVEGEIWQVWRAYYIYEDGSKAPSNLTEQTGEHAIHKAKVWESVKHVQDLRQAAKIKD